MKTYDKASWHIDGGENQVEVVKRFQEVFNFLDATDMLNEDGREVLEYAMDDDVVLNSYLLTKEGCEFLDLCYERVLRENPKEITKNLIIEYKLFIEAKHQK